MFTESKIPDMTWMINDKGAKRTPNKVAKHYKQMRPAAWWGPLDPRHVTRSTNQSYPRSRDNITSLWLDARRVTLRPRDTLTWASRDQLPWLLAKSFNPHAAGYDIHWIYISIPTAVRVDISGEVLRLLRQAFTLQIWSAVVYIFILSCDSDNNHYASDSWQ